MLYAFVTGLNNSNVIRLRHTREKVGKQMKQLLVLENMMSMEGSFKNYREMVKPLNKGVPCIPLVYVYRPHG